MGSKSARGFHVAEAVRQIVKSDVSLLGKFTEEDVHVACDALLYFLEKIREAHAQSTDIVAAKKVQSGILESCPDTEFVKSQTLSCRLSLGIPLN